MLSKTSRIVLASAIAFALTNAWPLAQAQTLGGTGARFITDYRPPDNPAYAELYEEFEDQRLLDDLADTLNANLRLPSSIILAVDECGTPNAFYQPNGQRVSICYELLLHLAGQFANEENFEDLFSGTFAFVLLHELGHALIDVLDLPITGREEDAADQLATLLLLDGSEEGEAAMVSAAVWFALNAQSEALDALVFADEHSLSAQRFYNILCWVHGASPEKNADLVDEGYLPADRAAQCPGEHRRLARSWEKLLAQYERKKQSH